MTERAAKFYDKPLDQNFDDVGEIIYKVKDNVVIEKDRKVVFDAGTRPRRDVVDPKPENIPEPIIDDVEIAQEPSK